MSQSGYTPIQLYHSTSTGVQPVAGNLADGELAINITDGKLFYKDGSTVKVIATTAGASGDVVGPASATDSSLAAYDGTTGKLIKQASTVTIAQGGTNQTAFTAPSGSVKGLVFFDGTSLATDATVTDVGYDTSTNTVRSNNLYVGGTISLAGSTGTSGYVLTSNGASAPTWQAASSGITTGKAIAMSMIFGF